MNSITEYIKNKCEEFGVDYDAAFKVIAGKYPDREPPKSMVTKIIKGMVGDDAIVDEDQLTEPTELNYIGKDPITGEKKYI